MATEGLVVTKKELAAMLTTSERTIRSLTKSGQISSFKIGQRGVRYRVEDLKAFIAKRIKQAEQEAEQETDEQAEQQA